MNIQNSYLTSKPHYEILDGLRGVAAAMVVAFSSARHLQQPSEPDYQSWLSGSRFLLHAFGLRHRLRIR